LIATKEIDFKKNLYKKLSEDEAKKDAKLMGTAVEDIEAGDLVEYDPATGQIKKVKTNLEKPLKFKKATNEKNSPKKSLKKKKRKASNGTK